MTAPKFDASISLVLRGDRLDPDIITDQFGVTPSRAQHKGVKQKFSSGAEYTTKIGLWAYDIKIYSNTISQNVDLLSSIFSSKKLPESNLFEKNISFIDVFIIADTNDEGEITFDFELTSENLTALKELGLPVLFTTTLINQNILPYGSRDGFILP